MSRMDDFVSFPEVLDLAPYMAPNRNDYKMANTPLGPRAAYMDWASPDQGHNLDPVNYKLYGTSLLPYIFQI
jgi:ubiquitin carboxyl-terminal hydrolase 16/45